mmetsp:Transcript_27424/g.40494  ORF Transcript_27424/g.40494 Transcript_27424/m.40494 type:complete len:102 (+) Transcript_27424:109-414(+)
MPTMNRSNAVRYMCSAFSNSPLLSASIALLTSSIAAGMNWFSISIESFCLSCVQVLCIHAVRARCVIVRKTDLPCGYFILDLTNFHDLHIVCVDDDDDDSS